MFRQIVRGKSLVLHYISVTASVTHISPTDCDLHRRVCYFVFEQSVFRTFLKSHLTRNPILEVEPTGQRVRTANRSGRNRPGILFHRHRDDILHYTVCSASGECPVDRRTRRRGCRQVRHPGHRADPDRPSLCRRRRLPAARRHRRPRPTRRLRPLPVPVACATPAKADEPIEVSFGLCTPEGPSNRVLGGPVHAEELF